MFHGHLDYSQNPPLGGRPNTKPRDHGTPNAQNHWCILCYHMWRPAWIEIHWNSILSAQNPHSCVRPSPSGCSWLTCNLTPHLPQFHCYTHCECKVINMPSYSTPYTRAYSTHLLGSTLKHKVLNIDQYFTPWLIHRSLCHSVLTNTPRLVILS